jgi:CBS domain containing-hemolysin-like protein
VLGFVHVKDVLLYEGAARRASIPGEVVRPLAVVPPDRTLAEVLLAMRRERRHMVLVGDGRTPLGVVTLDDVLTAVVRADAPSGSAAGPRPGSSGSSGSASGSAASATPG